MFASPFWPISPALRLSSWQPRAEIAKRVMREADAAIYPAIVRYDILLPSSLVHDHQPDAD
jgi:hypothetical protein